ncbi:MAG: hypothetical protein V1747_03215 [Candidatus Omnitrophota bacterium]
MDDDIIEQIKKLEEEVINLRKQIESFQNKAMIVGNDFRKEIRNLEWKEIKLSKKISDLKKNL